MRAAHFLNEKFGFIFHAKTTKKLVVKHDKHEAILTGRAMQLDFYGMERE